MLKGKRALITGARRGIGKAIAIGLAQDGADVGINDLELDAVANGTLRNLEDIGGNVSWHRADISDRNQIDRMFNEFLAEHGGIDILVNNAYIPLEQPFLDVTEEDFDFQINVCLKSYFLCSQRAAKEMLDQGTSGSILSLSSVQAYRSWPGQLVYGSIKAAISRMMLGMAWELSGNGINCNAVAPGYIDNRVLLPDEEPGRGDSASYADETKPWIPARRIGVPDDIAQVVRFLVSDMGRYVNGQTIVADGGFLSGGTPQQREYFGKKA